MEVVRRECVKCAQVGARGDRRRPVKFGDRKLPAGRDPGPHAQHGRGDEVRRRQRPLLHRDRVQPLEPRRRDRLGRPGRALPEHGPDRPHDEDRRLPGQGHRHAGQAGLGDGPEPGQRHLHPADALPQAHRADRRHRHLHQAQGGSRGGRGDDRRGAHDPPRAAQDQLPTATIPSVSSRRSSCRRSGAASPPGSSS